MMATTNRNVSKRNIMLVGHKTSVTLEDPFWNGLREIACSEHTSVSSLVEKIHVERNVHNLSSAIRLFVLAHFRATNQQKRPAPPGN